MNKMVQDPQRVKTSVYHPVLRTLAQSLCAQNKQHILMQRWGGVWGGSWYKKNKFMFNGNLVTCSQCC